MKHLLLTTITSALLTFNAAQSISAQAGYISSAKVVDDPTLTVAQAAVPFFERPDSVRSIEELDAFLASLDSIPQDTLVSFVPLPAAFFGPVVYVDYQAPVATNPFSPDYSGKQEMRWLEELNSQYLTMRGLNRYLFSNYPDRVRYNINMLPEAPKQYHAVLNVEDHTIEVREVISDAPAAPTVAATTVKKRHWIRAFNASLQFSQAYVSPNWYQGGNNNLNVLGQLYYNVKLNQEYHPNILFETTAQYKLGLNSTPEDTVHAYSISDDLLQINSTFGLKAAKRWYYSLTGQFKTQLFNNYGINQKQRRASFLSPAELNIGIGMTYNYANPKKTFAFDASIAPLSYNLKTCIDREINPTNYNIEEGHKTKSTFGSSAELKLTWKIAYNIVYTSRLFAFTDYDIFQGDWEHKITFDINRFLSTQIFCHMRYDTSTPPCSDDSWKKFQIKEILSIGFTYKFSTI